jgi:hypothetical protein
MTREEFEQGEKDTFSFQDEKELRQRGSMCRLSNKEIEQLIYGNGLYEVSIYAQRYEDEGFGAKWWVESKEGYPPLCAETLKKEFEKYGLEVCISKDKKQLSVQVEIEKLKEKR